MKNQKTPLQIQRMFERGVEKDDVNAIVSTGETVAEYPDDNPYPSQLLLRFVEGRRGDGLTATRIDELPQGPYTENNPLLL